MSQHGSALGIEAASSTGGAIREEVYYRGDRCLTDDTVAAAPSPLSDAATAVCHHSLDVRS